MDRHPFHAAAVSSTPSPPHEPLRDDPDVAALLFRLQAATYNRLGHLRRLHHDTRELREMLEARAGGGRGGAPGSRVPNRPLVPAPARPGRSAPR